MLLDLLELRRGRLVGFQAQTYAVGSLKAAGCQMIFLPLPTATPADRRSGAERCTCSPSPTTRSLTDLQLDHATAGPVCPLLSSRCSWLEVPEGEVWALGVTEEDFPRASGPGRMLHLRACALKLFSFHLFNPVSEPQTWMRQIAAVASRHCCNFTDAVTCPGRSTKLFAFQCRKHSPVSQLS